MSIVHAAGRRGPGVIRAVVKVGLGCVLLGGCSSGSERFGSLEFGSGYQAAPPPQTQVSRAALNSSSPYPAQQPPQYAAPQYAAGQPVSYQPSQGGYQVASATPGQNGGYLQVSRVDLPPLQQQQQAAPAYSGVKTADGYGPYNQPPLADGVYTGPRVSSPYDQPRDYAPPPPPPPPADEQRRYDPSSPPQTYYRRSDNDAPPYPPKGETRVYEPAPDYRDAQRYREESRDYDRAPERNDFYGRSQRSASSLGGADIRRPGDPVNGKIVTVQPGDTLYSLAIRHGVTVDMIVRANGLTSRHYVKPGAELLIPQAGPTKLGQSQGETQKAQTAGCTGEQCYTVKKGETVASIAHAHGLTEQQILEANNLPNARALQAGQTIVIPGREALASAAPQNRAPAPEVQAPAQLPYDSASKAPDQQKPGSETKIAGAKPAEPSCEAALANPLPRMGKNFRKPVEGLVIGQYGPQRDGSVNEGVTISVPKGTPIKAAENGVVAYVGDELPGFGNLILIRHADEYVTAYAHADEIMVKKCEVVKRGQQIAKAGATGDASQPQLHFEIRKNAKPVDPGPLLGS